MDVTDRQLLHSLSRMPFVESTELALILGEPHPTVHRHLTALLADAIVGWVSHGTVHLPSSGRYCLTAKGVREAAGVLDFDTPSDFVRAYPMSREWLTLLIRRMDAVAAIYRLASSLSPGNDGLRSHVEFHRRGRFDATVTLHDGRDFGVVRQGLALRRRSLYDRLRAIAEYNYDQRPGIVLVLVPSVWEQRLTARFCEQRDLRDCFVAVESRAALERRDLRLWCKTSWVTGSNFFSLEHVSSQGRSGRRPPYLRLQDNINWDTCGPNTLATEHIGTQRCYWQRDDKQRLSYVDAGSVKWGARRSSSASALPIFA